MLQSVTKLLHLLFLSLFQKIYHKCEKQKNFHQFQNNWQVVLARCDRYYKVRHNLLQRLKDITKWDRIYYNVRQVLQSVTIVTKWDRYYKVWQVLQTVTGITNCDRYYKMWQSET